MEAIQVHRKLLQKWRKAMDLVGPGAIEPHFEDSIGAVSNLHATGTWIDLGSGAGFPSIALAAYWPKAQVFCVESRHKRAVFLRRVIAEANLTNIQVLQCRSEQITEKFSGIISRAYKPPLEYLQDAARLSLPQARTVLLLGEHSKPKLPPIWKIVEEHTYKVNNGYRKRWVLQQRL